MLRSCNVTQSRCLPCPSLQQPLVVASSSGRPADGVASSSPRPRNAKAAATATATAASLGGLRTIRHLDVGASREERDENSAFADMEAHINVREVCKDGFCSMSTMDEMAALYAGLRQPEFDESHEGAGASLLGGLAVKTLDMGGLQSNVVVRPNNSGRDSSGNGVLSSPVHPDAVARQKAREARKAGRKRNASMMANTQWWNCTELFNMKEVKSEEEYMASITEATACGKTVVVDFFAPWCQACHRQYPDFVRFAATHPDYVFLKVNAANLRPFCEALGVERLPSYSVYPPLYPEDAMWKTSFFKSLTSKLDSSFQF